MRCKNKVSQYVPRGYTVREVKTPCGSTGVYGDTLYCEDCLRELGRRYPQGWRHHPGDLCKHGYYVGDAGGPDYMCPICEGGD